MLFESNQQFLFHQKNLFIEGLTDIEPEKNELALFIQLPLIQNRSRENIDSK